MAISDAEFAALAKDLGENIGLLKAANSNVATLTGQMTTLTTTVARVETKVEATSGDVNKISARIEKGDEAFEDLRRKQDAHEGRIATIEKKEEGTKGIWWTLTQLGIAGVISWLVAKATGSAAVK